MILEMFITLWMLINVTEEFNRKLLEICESENNLYCINLGEEVPRTLDYMYDDMHFNENGANFVAKEISNFIKELVEELSWIDYCIGECIICSKRKIFFQKLKFYRDVLGC